MSTDGNAKTFVFFPEGAFGPTNNCIGIAEVLRDRGHRVVFVIEESFAGTLAAKGFEEALMRLSPAPEAAEEPGQFWKDFVRETLPVFRTTTFEQLEGFIKPVWEELIAGATYVDERLREIWDEVQPDVIVQDNVVAFPAVPASGRPWVRIMSCNPLEMRDAALPPTFSGMPTADPSGRIAFRHRYRDLLRPLQQSFSALCEERGAPALGEMEFIHESPWLNLFVYPEETDYPRSKPLAATWHRLDTCVRDSGEPYALGEAVRMRPGDSDRSRLLYLSLGSLGSADIELMNRLTELLSRSPHRVLVSTGPQGEEVVLHERMTGASFLPQPAILPQVDLVITHGGNNTVTESFLFGAPMLVLPLFWDQHDNAQRVQETGFGVRLATYTFSEMEFFTALDRLLFDTGLHERSAALSKRLLANPGTSRAADLLERLARTGAPVLD